MQEIGYIIFIYLGCVKLSKNHGFKTLPFKAIHFW